MEDKLLKLLQDERVITPAQYQQAIRECEKSAARAEMVLEQLGMLKEEDLVKFLSKKFRMPLIKWEEYTVDQELLQMVPEPIAIKYSVFPYALERGKRGGKITGKITLAVADPSDVSAVDDISFRTGCVVKTAVASARAIHHAIQTHYAAPDALPGAPELDAQPERLRAKEKFSTTKIEVFDALLSRLASPEELAEEEPDVLATLDQDHPATKFLLEILANAVERGVSEIQIDPAGAEQQVRLRSLGVISPHATIPDQLGRGLAARLRKLILRMEPAGLAKKEQPPWLGSFYTTQIKGRPLTVLVSFYPTLAGEKILLKIADGAALMPLEQLGLTEKSQKVFQRILAKSEGLLLFVSPPRQGKTTTLHATLQQFDRAALNIMTLENPVEMLLPGISQIAFNPQIPYRHWAALLTYHNPDLLAVENVACALMAHVAFELAASTLVLASLTAADPADGLFTFLTLLSSAFRPERGAAFEKRWQEPELLLLDAVNGLVSQRLVRTLCPHCKEELPVSQQDPALMEWLLAEEQNAGRFPVHVGKGCRECRETGYNGQTGLFEVIKFDKQVRQFFLQAPPAAALQLRPFLATLPAETFKQQALQKIRAGLTSPAEVRRVLWP